MLHNPAEILRGVVVALPGEHDGDVDRGDPRWVLVCLSDGVPKLLPKEHRELLLDIRHVLLRARRACCLSHTAAGRNHAFVMLTVEITSSAGGATALRSASVVTGAGESGFALAVPGQYLGVHYPLRAEFCNLEI